jgi:hypothetical protein
MTPREILALMVALAAAIALARWVAARRGRPKRVRYDDPARQIEADYPPAQRDEAAALVESIVQHARPDDRDVIRRRVLDAARGDITRLRRSAPKAKEALDRVYRLIGDDRPGGT